MTFPSLLLVALLCAAPEPAPRPFALRALIPLTVGAVLMVGGGILLGVSAGQANEAQRLEPDPREALLFAATSNRVGGVMLLVSGVLVSSLAAFLFWFVPAPRVTIGLTPIAGGARGGAADLERSRLAARGRAELVHPSQASTSAQRAGRASATSPPDPWCASGGRSRSVATW